MPRIIGLSLPRGLIYDETGMFSRLRNPGLVLYAAAFFVSSWDLLLMRKVGGFTLKAYQPLFLLCAAVTFWPLVRAARLEELVAPLRRPFALAMLGLAFFYLGLSPWSAFPLKSFLYSAWLLFDLSVLWLATQHLFASQSASTLTRVAFAPLLFSTAVILVDYAAYPFGYRGGLIGYNQDILTNLHVSRPHAFDSEPSYAAVYLSLGLLTLGPYLLQQARKKWLTGGLLSLVLFAILATTSRSGWACLALGFLLLIVLPVLAGKRFPWRAALTFFAAVPVLIGILLLTSGETQRQNLYNSFVAGILHGNDTSGVSRMHSIGIALDMARDTSGKGAGLGASYKYFKEHGGFDLNFSEDFNQRMYGNEVIMSGWGQLLGEGGPLAVLLYALSAVLLIGTLWRAWREKNSALAYGSLAAAVVYFSFAAWWLGNICRGDMWVWFAFWSGCAANGQKTKT